MLMIMLFILVCCTNTKFSLKEKADKGEQMQPLHRGELDLPPSYGESVSVQAVPSAPPLPGVPQLDVSDVSKEEAADRGVVERNFTINTVLHKAIDARDIESIKKMWDKQSSEIKLSEQDKIGASCLVAGLGYEDIFRVLGEERNELTVAREAVKNGHKKIATEIFIARGAEYVHKICLEGDLGAIDTIVKNNDKLFKTKDRKGKLAIDYLIVVMREGINDELKDMFIKLLKKINKEDKDKLLIEELDNKKINKNMFNLLIKIGVEVNAVTQDGVTALMMASYRGHREVCELLIKMEADVNATTKDGRTALHFAAEKEHKKVCELLIEKGAGVNIQEKKGKTALYIAAIEGHEEVCELLIKMGAEVNAKNNDGKTALMFVAESGSKEVAKVLIEMGADVNAKNNYGKTALMFAAGKGSKEVAKVLIEMGADVNLQNYDGWTALMFAARSGNKEIEELLRSKGAKGECIIL